MVRLPEGKRIFQSVKVPSPEKEGDNYQVRYWSQTDYLKKVVQHESRINDILQIINKISNYEDEKGNLRIIILFGVNLLKF